MFRSRRPAYAESSNATIPPATATAIQGSIRPPEYTRQQHLDSYLQDETLSKSTRRVSTDDSTYDTVFQTVDQWTLILRVHLPLPSSATSTYIRPPAMTLAGVKARHVWLDSRMQVVGFAPISSDANWTQARILLGAAVLQVIQHLQIHPPEVLEIVDRGLLSIQRRAVGTTATSSTSQSSNTGRNNVSPIRTAIANSAPISSSSAVEAAPPYETFFTQHSSSLQPTLPSVPTRFDLPTSTTYSGNNKKGFTTTTTTQQLMEDEIAFLNYCNSLEYTQTLVTLVESALERNRTAARDNLKQQEALLDLHSQVAELELSLQASVAEFESLQAQQDKICQPPPLKEIQRVLQRCKKRAFDLSESMAEEWDGTNTNNESTSSFFEKFVQLRKVHHVRAAKLELLLLQQQQPSI